MLAIFAVVALIWILKVPNIQVSDFGYLWAHANGALHGQPLYVKNTDYFAVNGFCNYSIDY